MKNFDKEAKNTVKNELAKRTVHNREAIIQVKKRYDDLVKRGIIVDEGYNIKSYSFANINLTY